MRFKIDGEEYVDTNELLDRLKATKTSLYANISKGKFPKGRLIKVAVPMTRVVWKVSCIEEYKHLFRRYNPIDNLPYPAEVIDEIKDIVELDESASD